MLPRISIVTPSLNQGEFLENTIDSVVSQNYPNLDYVIMDGGSSDQSAAIIKRFEKSLSSWESRKDNGQADAINRGFAKSTGAIFGWLNSDDILLPHSLEVIGTWFQENPDELWAVGSGLFMDEQGAVLLNGWRTIPFCRFGQNICFRSLLFWECDLIQPSVFFRKEAFFQAGGLDPNLQFCFDYDLFLRYAKRKRSGKIGDFLSAFRIHKKSKSSTMDDVRRKEDLLLQERHGKNQFPLAVQIFWRVWYRLRSRLNGLGRNAWFLLLPEGRQQRNSFLKGAGEKNSSS